MGVPALHVIGCGRAGRAIARRLIATGRVRPGLVINRTLESAADAVAFIGGGEPATVPDERLAGGWLMLGLPDGVLASEIDSLSQRMPLRPALAFHLSGALPADVLLPLDVPVASVHPVRAFADPRFAVEHFERTWCVAEGTREALDCLQPVFEAAGARWLSFASTHKGAWHAATVAASNFLVTTQALARELAVLAGLPEARAAEVLTDLQQGTLESVRASDPVRALTGPIERSDFAACRRLVDALEWLPAQQRQLFGALALATLDLAVVKRGARDNDADLRKLLRSLAGRPTND